jgi:hypothetical protein
MCVGGVAAAVFREPRAGLESACSAAVQPINGTLDVSYPKLLFCA